MSSVKDTQAQALLDVFHGNNVDKKLEAMVTMKANIKHQSVQIEAIPLLFEACKLGIKQTANNTLFLQSFSCLGHLINRVLLQEPSRLRPQCKGILPLLISKMGDAKERVRSMAKSCIMNLYRACPAEVEKAVSEYGFISPIARAREMTVRLLADLHATVPGFSFKSYTPFLMQLLEDTDAEVRETTKNVVVELFKNAPGHAKADLKRMLKTHEVRKAIATAIINQLNIPAEYEDDVRSQSRAGTREGASAKAPKGVAGNGVSTGATSAYVASLPGSEMEPTVEPAYVNTNRELENELQDMLEAFDGRESEQNWLAREKNVTRLRALLRGNAYRDYSQTFLAGIATLRDGMIKAMTSLRTTLSSNGTQLVKDLLIVCGPALDPVMIDFFLTNLIKLCAGTKKITAQLANVVTAVLVANVNYSPKVMNHIWFASQDKNVQPRTFACGWIRAILESHIDQKSYMESSGGVDIFEKCLKKGVTDANPGVRENMRVTFWKFAEIWPQRAEAILESLEGTNKTLLEKANPNGGKASTKDPPARKPAAGAAKPSIRDTIAAQRRQMTKTDSAPAVLSVPLKDSSSSRSGPTRAPPKSRPGTGLGNYGDRDRAASPALSTRAGGVRSPPPTSPPRSLRTVRSTPMRQQSPAVGRRITVLEQLNHPDVKVRVDGIVTVACLFAKRTPPGYEAKGPAPTLPPADLLAPALQRLLYDEHMEVVEHVVAPEVLPELAKVVPMDQIIMKVLLLSESDDGEVIQPIASTSLPALKKMMTEDEAAHNVFDIITKMGVAGTVPRKMATGAFTPRDKKRIIHGALKWMNELLDSVLDGTTNEYLLDHSNYRANVNRLISMLNKTKPPNYVPLANVLKKFQTLDPTSFDRILSTFDSTTVKELHSAWGLKEKVPPEEKVAGVEQVLGAVPRVGGQPSSRPVSRDHIPSAGEKSPTLLRRRPGLEPTLTGDEELTMIQPLSALSSAGVNNGVPPQSLSSAEDKENKGVPMSVNIPTAEYPATDDTVTLAKALSTGDIEPGAVQTEPKETVMSEAAAKAKRTLQSLVTRIKTREIDSVALKKLSTLAREYPVKAPLSVNNGEDNADIWKGGRIFDDLMKQLLDFLRDDCVNSNARKAEDLQTTAILVIRELSAKCTFYFSKHEPSVITALFDVDKSYLALSNSIEEFLEQIVTKADPISSLSAVLSYLESNPNLPPQTTSKGLRTLAHLIPPTPKPAFEAFLTRMGQLGVRFVNAEDAALRRCCKDMIVEMHVKVADDKRLFDCMKGLQESQYNLLMYYFKRRDNEAEGR